MKNYKKYLLASIGYFVITFVNGAVASTINYTDKSLLLSETVLMVLGRSALSLVERLRGGGDNEVGAIEQQQGQLLETVSEAINVQDDETETLIAPSSAPKKKKKKKKKKKQNSNNNQIEDLPVPPNQEDEPIFNEEFLNGIPFNRYFAREVVLPSTDNNCGIFAIYGRVDITRDQVVEELLRYADGTDERSEHIRDLMGYEIEAYLLPIIQGSNIFTKSIHEWFLKTGAFSLEDYARSGDAFRIYVRNFLGKRIDNSPDDPYPFLEYIPHPDIVHFINDPLRAAQLPGFGSLAAIAFMRGVSLRVFQRDHETGHIQNMGGVVFNGPDGELTTLVNVLLTTADPENPSARNHFNLLESIDPLIWTEYQSELRRPKTWCTNVENGFSQLMTQIAKEKAEFPIYGLDSSTKEFWSARLGFDQFFWKNKKYAKLDSDEESPLLNNIAGVRNILKGWSFPDFALSEKEAIKDMWLGLLEETLTLIEALNRNYKHERTAERKKFLSIKNKKHEKVSFGSNVLAENNERFLIDQIQSLKPIGISKRNLQLVILRFAQILKQRLAEFETGNMPLIMNYNTSMLYHKSHEIALIRYFLKQLIQICRLYGYDPFVVAISEDLRASNETDVLLLSALEAIASELKLESSLQAAASVVSKPIVGSQKPNKKKRNRGQAPTHTTPTQMNVSEMAMPLRTQASQDSILESSIDAINRIAVSENQSDKSDVLQQASDNEIIIVSNNNNNNNNDAYDAYDAEHYERLCQMFYEEMRAKKKQQRSYQKEQVSAPLFVDIIENEIGVLTPEERSEFQQYINQNAKANIRKMYEQFKRAEDAVLSNEDIEVLGQNIAKHLRDFLKKKVDASKKRLFSDEAIERFIKTFLNEHQKSFHNFHPKKGTKVPRQWMQFRHAPWIARGIMPVEIQNRSSNDASVNYESGLVRRMLRQVNKKEL